MKATIFMKIALLVLCSSLIEICHGQTALSKDYPYLRKVPIVAQTTFDNSYQMYYYSYSLYNDSANCGNIETFEIDISRDSLSSDIDTIGLRFAGSDYFENDFRDSYPKLASHIVPVGFSNLPSGWQPIWGIYPEASLSLYKQEFKPGSKVKGITLMSKGLPGIRSFVVIPDFNIYEFFPDQNDTATTNIYVPPIDSVREAINYRGITIGPSSIPILFVPEVFLDTLSSYTIQSRALNWIKNRITANRYLGYFASAKLKLHSNKISDVSSILNTVLFQANADSTINLTSKAYALIRYNTEYLIAHLPLIK